MLKLCLCGWLVFLSAAAGCAFTPSDEAEIIRIIDSYTHAWNQQEGRGFGDDFAADATFVNIFGTPFVGREEIEARHVKILQTLFKNSTLQIQNVNLREIQPGLVIALVRWAVNPLTPVASLKVREGIFTQVFYRTDNQWKIVASQNTLSYP
jgi:uncharacterized protein (TIGR02246 family)